QYEVRLAKVRLDIGIAVTPSVPGGLALLEQRDVLFVRHGSTPEVLEKNDAAVVDGSERSDHCPNDLAKQQATATPSASTSKSSSFHSPDRREADARLRTKVHEPKSTIALRLFIRSPRRRLHRQIGRLLALAEPMSRARSRYCPSSKAMQSRSAASAC